MGAPPALRTQNPFGVTQRHLEFRPALRSVDARLSCSHTRGSSTIAELGTRRRRASHRFRGDLVRKEVERNDGDRWHESQGTFPVRECSRSFVGHSIFGKQALHGSRAIERELGAAHARVGCVDKALDQDSATFLDALQELRQVTPNVASCLVRKLGRARSKSDPQADGDVARSHGSP